MLAVVNIKSEAPQWLKHYNEFMSAICTLLNTLQHMLV